MAKYLNRDVTILQIVDNTAPRVKIQYVENDLETEVVNLDQVYVTKKEAEDFQKQNFYQFNLIEDKQEVTTSKPTKK